LDVFHGSSIVSKLRLLFRPFYLTLFKLRAVCGPVK
jgi:hypothetical protein